MIIPVSQLNDDTLNAVIREYIMREGTDYGSFEVTLDSKISQVRMQLEKGDVILTYDSYLRSCNILPRDSKELYE